MKKGDQLFLVGLVCVGIVLLLLFTRERDASKAQRPGQSGREGQEIEVTPALLDSIQGRLDLQPVDSRELAELDSDRFYSGKRSRRDPAYLRKVKKHNLIQQYLDASRRGDPNYEAVLHILLRNGYGIKDWATTCRTIMQWYLPFYIRENNLKKLGYPQEVIDENLRVMHEIRVGDFDLIKEALVHDVGITNTTVLDELMAIPIVHEYQEFPFGHGPYNAYEGDLLLTDEDWMTAEHQASRAAYQGEPRKWPSDSARVDAYRDWKADQLGISFFEVPPLNRNYVGFDFPPVKETREGLLSKEN